MLLVHLPALLADWKALLAQHAEHVHPLSFAALNLSALFFILKIRGVRWLEFGRDPRSLLALGVAVAILHIHVVRDHTTAVPQESQVVATVLFTLSLTQVQRLLGRAATRRRCLRDDLAFLGHCLDDCVTTITRHRDLALAPRAPPA